MSIIKYVIADDHKIFREGLKFAINDDYKLKLVGEAENGKVLLQVIQKQKPDVVILDIKMPEMDGLEAMKRIKATYPETKVLVLTMYDDEQFIMHLMESGANGYLLKNADPMEIRNAIHTVMENNVYFNDLVGSAMLKKVLHKSPIIPHFKEDIELTDKDLKLIQLIAQEYTTVEIAEKMYLSPRTIEGLRGKLLDKIGVRSTVGVITYAIKNHIIF